ncbi:19909_t:CDS:2 [Gigaspora margarita]|uniref:19909_t:CDS:1 n=1 Tax=Gigaspora margarita TaxID=4874 RepID=A0ABN7UJ40_GIGMA|nr:19909_t:CDS:2 [Gigaspora margarita]
MDLVKVDDDNVSIIEYIKRIKVARLLIVCHKSPKNNETNFHFSICDPFASYIPEKSYVKADDLFKDFDVKFDNFEN